MVKIDRHHNPSMTFADLAQELGVSRASVSYALNGKPGVSPGLRQRILKTARRKGLISKEIDKTSVGSIGMILADLGNPFYAAIAAEATKAARSQQVELLLSHSDDEPEAIAKASENMAQSGVKGIILTTLNVGEGALVRDLRSRHTPIVLLSRRVPQLSEIPFDGIDDFGAGYALMAHVISHGYRDIAIATGGFSSFATRQRIKGFLAAAEEKSIHIPRTSVMSTSLNVLGGDIAAEHLLGSGKLPQVVVCGADAIATGLINRLAVAGISVPEDIAIAGFDGIPSTQHPFLDLTTIIQPIDLMARGAIAKILKLAAGEDIENPITIHPHKLHIGSSCGVH